MRAAIVGDGVPESIPGVVVEGAAPIGMAMFSATVLPPWFCLAFRGAVRVCYLVGRRIFPRTIGLASAIVEGLEAAEQSGRRPWQSPGRHITRL
jgi:hypothetical protein